MTSEVFQQLGQPWPWSAPFGTSGYQSPSVPHLTDRRQPEKARLKTVVMSRMHAPRSTATGALPHQPRRAAILPRCAEVSALTALFLTAHRYSASGAASVPPGRCISTSQPVTCISVASIATDPDLSSTSPQAMSPACHPEHIVALTPRVNPPLPRLPLTPRD